MGIQPNIRTQNAVPIFCDPPRAGDVAWTLDYEVGSGSTIR
jgi:hypothetical protein